MTYIQWCTGSNESHSGEEIPVVIEFVITLLEQVLRTYRMFVPENATYTFPSEQSTLTPKGEFTEAVKVRDVYSL